VDEVCPDRFCYRFGSIPTCPDDVIARVACKNTDPDALRARNIGSIGVTQGERR
jgi:hypothetical protein